MIQSFPSRKLVTLPRLKCPVYSIIYPEMGEETGIYFPSLFQDLNSLCISSDSIRYTLCVSFELESFLPLLAQ